MTKPKLPPPSNGSGGYLELAELVDTTVEITEIDDVAGVPFVVVDGDKYLCESEWAQQGATTLQAYMATNGEDSVTVKVVDHKRSGVGFVAADDE